MNANESKKSINKYVRSTGFYVSFAAVITDA
jgi:hypothetical protein